MSTPEQDRYRRSEEYDSQDSADAGTAAQIDSSSNQRQPPSPRGRKLRLPKPNINSTDQPASATSSSVEGQLSPAAADRVFPIRSVISVDPTPTPSARPDPHNEGYFQSVQYARRASLSSADTSQGGTPGRRQKASIDSRISSRGQADQSTPSDPSRPGSATPSADEGPPESPNARQPPKLFHDIISGDSGSVGSEKTGRTASGVPGERERERHASGRSNSFRSTRSGMDEIGPLVTARFKHIVTEGGHAIITGRDGETLQQCEDEPIHIPGAVQGFGLLIALEEQSEGRLLVRVVSENSKRMIGYSPKQLFALESFTDILSEDQADNLLDHIDFIRDEDADVTTNGPEVFTISIRSGQRKSQKLWCAMHINDRHPNLLICEFELEDDPVNPLVPPNEQTPEPPEDTLDSQPTAEEFQESTQNFSKPLRVLRSARKRKGEAAAMEVFNIMSQVQEQLATAPSLEGFLKILVGVVKELTGFHRVMIYQFDASWNGKVVTELVDPRATKDLYKGLNFPASDIPKQARDLYKLNKVRMLYDRDLETARLVCRTTEDLETPLDLTYSYLRAMSPIHIKYLTNMAVRSSMSISINAFQELWGLIACHGYGSKGMRVSFPIRKMCRLVGDSASRNIERLSYASRLQARKLINTVPTQTNPSGYIIASSEDLLKLFNADFGMLSIRGETKILGHIEKSQEALAMLEYLRMRSITSVMTSLDVREDFPDLRYAPGFSVIAGLLIVPLSGGGQDFIVFFRKGQIKEVKWAGNPYEKYIKEGTEGYLEPRKSFRTWSETIVGKCREWTEEEIETAAVLCLVYGKFIEVWRQKEIALQNSQLTRLLLANSAHEVRTPLNAIINYLEIALEGSLDQETRDNLAKSHSASKSLIYVINDLLDLTKTEEGGELVKDEVFDLKATLYEATDMFKGDAKRKNIGYEVSDSPGLPGHVIGDQRRIRQVISNITANAIQNTTEGSVKVDMYPVAREDSRVDVEISVEDTGVGMNDKKLDALFRELEQVQSESEPSNELTIPDADSLPESSRKGEQRALGLGLAVVARIVRNMNGQLRLKSEEGKGSRFVIQFPFDLPDSEPKQQALESGGGSSQGSITPLAEGHHGPSTPPTAGEVTLVERGSATRQNSGRGSQRNEMMVRKNSNESIESRLSMGSGRSNLSHASAKSNRSEAERLIEAIQEPHQVEGWHGDNIQRTSSRGGMGNALASPRRPPLEKRHTASGATGDVVRTRARSLELTPQAPKVGQTSVTDQRTPLSALRMPDESSVSSQDGDPRSAGSLSMPQLPQLDTSDVPETKIEAIDAEHLKVLVAEDDPVNSRIIKKRLEKLGHDVFLTGNGEECSTTYSEKSGFFDIILMDMQMPIVDGLTSAKMIRSFEKSHPTHILSTRASLNKRVPIIAVSASLVVKERQTYIDAGFDGWILKPISFNRLSEIMTGIVDHDIRRKNLFTPGGWEHGGWFRDVQQDVFAADTKPNFQPPQSAPSDGVKAAAADDDPSVKEEGDSGQSQEQNRMLAQQHQERVEDDTVDAGEAPKSYSMPELGSRRLKGDNSSDTVTTAITAERVQSPAPIDQQQPSEQG